MVQQCSREWSSQAKPISDKNRFILQELTVNCFWCCAFFYSYLDQLQWWHKLRCLFKSSSTHIRASHLATFSKAINYLEWLFIVHCFPVKAWLGKLGNKGVWLLVEISGIPFHLDFYLQGENGMLGSSELLQERCEQRTHQSKTTKRFPKLPSAGVQTGAESMQSQWVLSIQMPWKGKWTVLWSIEKFPRTIARS